MKKFFRKIIIAVCLLITACGQVLQVTPSVAPLTKTATETKTPSPTITPSPSTTATIEPTPMPTYVWPTLIPTIDPMLLPELVLNAFSVQTMEGVNGHKIRQITGWDHGFGAGIWQYSCPGYFWLDQNHILLYPQAGQRSQALVTDASLTIGVVPQPAVINLDNGELWLPNVNTSSGAICNYIHWSPELKILVVPSIYEGKPVVFTYSIDGTKLATYPGKLLDVSPKGTKILLTDYKVIDLRTNKKIKLNWDQVPYEYYWDFYWTSDETRIYRCCYFYADLVSGKNFRFAESDFLDSEGNPFEYAGLSIYRGQWIQNDTNFLVEWSYLDDGDMRYLPMFDPEKRIFFDVRERAGISNEWTCYYTKVSPDDQYVWMAGADGSYLIDLFTFEAQFYSGQDFYYIDWSPNSNFIWIDRPHQEDEDNKYNILSIVDKEASPLPISPALESEHLWHTIDNIVVYPAKDKNTLVFLNTETMSFRELPFKDQESQYKITNLAWNPNGDKLVFITEDHILWKVDYPSLENLEQIISSANTISSVQWSPDGKSIAFVNGSDIYIVDTTK